MSMFFYFLIKPAQFGEHKTHVRLVAAVLLLVGTIIRQVLSFTADILICQTQ